MNAGTCALSERLISSQENLSGRESGSSRTNSLSASRAPTSVTFSSGGGREGRRRWKYIKAQPRWVKPLVPSLCIQVTHILWHTHVVSELAESPRTRVAWSFHPRSASGESPASFWPRCSQWRESLLLPQWYPQDFLQHHPSCLCLFCSSSSTCI